MASTYLMKGLREYRHMLLEDLPKLSLLAVAVWKDPTPGLKCCVTMLHAISDRMVNQQALEHKMKAGEEAHVWFIYKCIGSEACSWIWLTRSAPHKRNVELVNSVLACEQMEMGSGQQASC